MTPTEHLGTAHPDEWVLGYTCTRCIEHIELVRRSKNNGSPKFVDGPVGPRNSLSPAIAEFMETGNPDVPGL